MYKNNFFPILSKIFLHRHLQVNLFSLSRTTCVSISTHTLRRITLVSLASAPLTARLSLTLPIWSWVTGAEFCNTARYEGLSLSHNNGLLFFLHLTDETLPDTSVYNGVSRTPQKPLLSHFGCRGYRNRFGISQKVPVTSCGSRRTRQIFETGRGVPAFRELCCTLQSSGKRQCLSSEIWHPVMQLTSIISYARLHVSWCRRNT